MGEADLPLLNRLHALRQLGHPLSDRDPIAHRVARQVAVDTNPVVGGGRALPVPEVGLDEFRREPGLLEQQQVDLALVFDQLLGEKGASVDHLEHAQSVRTFDSNIKPIYTPSNPPAPG